MEQIDGLTAPKGIEMTPHELALQMIKLYGKEMQMVVAVEELGELQKEVLKALRQRANPKHIAEEIADVEIVLEQLKVMFPEVMEDIDRIKMEKVKRTYEEYLK